MKIIIKIIILLLLAFLLITKVMGTQTSIGISKLTQNYMQNIRQSLKMFKLDNGNYHVILLQKHLYIFITKLTKVIIFNL